MTGKLEAFAKANDVRYFLFNFTDIRGMQRSKLVPAAAAPAMEEAGAGFAGFATYLDMTPAHPDMLAVPDTSSVIRLPWQPDVAWVAGDLVMDGRPVEHQKTDPFVVLGRLKAYRIPFHALSPPCYSAQHSRAHTAGPRRPAWLKERRRVW